MKSNLDQRNWQVVIEERILQFKSMKDSSINDICYAIKQVTIKWVTMSTKGMYLTVCKTHFYAMYKLYVDNLISLFFFWEGVEGKYRQLYLNNNKIIKKKKTHICIWITINIRKEVVCTWGMVLRKTITAFSGDFNNTFFCTF